MTTAAVLLAGGRGTRLGGARPKPMMPLAGMPLAEHVLRRIRPHLRTILVSANEASPFLGLGAPIVADIAGAGPLAGLHAAAHHLAGESPPVTRILSVPGDTPFLPEDFCARMLAGGPAKPRVACHAGRPHPTLTLWPSGVLLDLGSVLADPAGARSIRAALERCGYEIVEFPDDPAAPDGDPFFNVNTPADLERAEAAFRMR